MKFCKIVSCILAVVLLIMPIQALAVENIELTKSSRITIEYKDGETPIPGAKFKLYLVAEADKNGKMTVTDDFRHYNIKLDFKDDAEMQALAVTLEGYALRDNIEPLDSGVTNLKGFLTFRTNGQSLKPGLYLIIGESHTQNDKIYEPSPFTVMLPSRDSETGDYVYDLNVLPKFIIHPIPSTPDKEHFKVIKLWEDDGFENHRPTSIAVELLHNGEVVETVILNEANRWTYKWETLDGSYGWNVTEDIPNGYSVTITQEGNTFIITNKSDKTDSTTRPSDSDTTTNPNNPSKPDKTEDSSKIDKTDKNDRNDKTTKPGSSSRQDRLPQTGQLWWPVPMLICLGAMLVIFGFIRRRNGRPE